MKRWTTLSFLAVFALSGCGMLDMPDETKAMNKKMDVTNNGVHLQILGIALQELLSPKFTDNLENTKVPTDMMRYAKIFTDEASPTEIIEAYYTFYKDMLLGYNENVEVNTVESLRLHQRYISYVAGGLIAAMMSDEKFETILREQIEAGGTYEFAAYTLAYQRYDALQGYFLHDMASGSDANVSSLRKAVGYYRSIKALARKPYASKFKLLLPKFTLATMVVKGEPLNPDDWTAEFSSSDATQKGDHAYQFFQAKLDAGALANPEIKALMSELSSGM